ncbi:MAG TPA: hypothetical protein VMI09_09685 [Candidatus Binataceae bacterium]|nr:hypothetical protein [Candidatus Binataceae bacterium]
MRRTLWRLIVFGAAFAFAACSMLHSGKPAASGAPSASSAEASSDASAQASPSAEGSPAEAAPGAESTPGAEGASSDANPPAPGATVAVSYAHKGDYLASLSVSKYSGAEMVESRNVDPQHVESIILFDGGVTVWEIKADTGVFSKLPVLGSGDKFAVKSVAYGKLPDHFVQATPDSGQPEPLETGHYYIFTAQRASGTLSYEAVRVEADGTLDGYAAEPRAGTSYVLCCNVNPDFVQPAPPLVPPADSDSGP